MGKGGDAAAKSKGMQLSEKVQKYTWAEVKKHVSCLFAGFAISNVTGESHLSVPSTVRSHPTMPGLCTRTKCTTSPRGMSIPVAGLFSPTPEMT